MLTISAEVVGSDQIPPVRPPEDAERAFRVTASDFSLAGASNAIAGTQFDFAIGYACVASLSVSVGGAELDRSKARRIGDARRSWRSCAGAGGGRSPASVHCHGLRQLY